MSFPSGHVANEHVKFRRTGKHAVPFRPFFPLAALLAMIGVPLWLLVLQAMDCGGKDPSSSDGG